MRRALFFVVVIAAVVVGWRVLRDGGGESRRETPRPSRAPDAAPADGGTTPRSATSTIELRHPPASHYAAPIELDTADEDYAARVEGHGAEYDPHLARAAREYAYQWAVLGDSPPEDAMSFLLRSAGAVDLSVAQVVVQSAGDRDVVDRALAAALADPPPGQGPLRVGVGEVATPGERYDRRVTVLVGRRDYAIEPTPRKVAAGSTWIVRGELPKGVSDVHGVALSPAGLFIDVEVDVARDGQSFEARVPAGTTPGELKLSIGGTGRSGPGKLLQLEAVVARELPRRFEVVWPVAEIFDDVAAAEAHAAELIDRDRAAANLAPLSFDEDLAAIARAHSEEMRDESFFGHLSPTTGLAIDRLRAAGYRASRASENLAFNDSLAEAQASLMDSIGHRKNLLDTEVTRVGVGVALGERQGRPAFWVTQLFSRPIENIDSERAVAEILARLDRARLERGVPPLRLATELMPIAVDGARRAATGQLEELSDELARAAAPLSDAGVAVSVQRVPLIGDVTIPEVALGADFVAIAVAAAQNPDDVYGSVGVVLLLSR